MKNRYLVIMLAIVAVAVMLMSGATYGRHDLGELEFVRCMGFDIGDEVTITATVTTGETEGKDDSEAVSGKGKSINEAVGKIKTAREKSAFFGYVSQYVIGEETAREGISDIMDYACRDVYSRPDTPCYIVKGASAKELVEWGEEQGKSLSVRLMGLEEEHSGTNLPRGVDVREILAAMERTGSCLVPGVERQGEMVVLAGYGVIKDAKLVGWIEPELVVAANMMLGHKGAMMVTVDLPSGGVVSLNLVSYSKKLKLELDEDIVIGCTVEIDAKFDLAGVMGIEDVDEQLQKIDTAAEAMVCEQAQRVLALRESLDADFLDLQCAVKAQAGNVRCDDMWVKVEVSGDLMRSYEITDE